MKRSSRIKIATTLLACCLGLGLTAGLAGVGVGARGGRPALTPAPLEATATDGEARQVLQEHLDQRLRLHLTRAVHQPVL